MAAAAPVTTEAPAAPAPAAPKAPKTALWIVLGIVLSTAAGGGVSFFVARMAAPQPHAEGGAGTDKAEEKKGPALYSSLDPVFVVNLDDDESMRYLQVNVEVMTRETAVQDALKAHAPLIRNNLLMLFSQQRYADLDSREGREKLQVAALAEIQKVLTEQTGTPGAEAVLFTSFVMQ